MQGTCDFLWSYRRREGRRDQECAPADPRGASYLLMRYDAILIVSFGGPERTDDVIPFLENVLRGRNVPRERMFEVAEHYYHFDGSSPINQQCRDLICALRERVSLPIYLG